MAQQVKIPATKSDEVSLSPQVHTMGREDGGLQGSSDCSRGTVAPSFPISKYINS